MPRPKRPGVPEPKRRSRNGCWPCKNRKVKCGEERPACVNCQRTGETCDYSIRLNWEGRKGKQVDSNVIAFARGSLPPTIPARGFKLVHQYPSADSPGGRRVEPLGASPYRHPGPDHHMSPSQTSVNFVATPQSFSSESEQHSSKRVKLSDAQQAEYTGRPYSSHSSTLESSTATLRLSVSSGVSAASPLTPATSSTYSDDGQPQMSRTEHEASSHPTKRLSVNSLLAGPAHLRALYNDSASHTKGMLPPPHTSPSSNEPTFYGIDRGLQDYDLGKNDDMNAIGSSPLLQRESLDISPREPIDYSHNQFIDAAEVDDGYYSKPVPIYIPRYLEPLPSRLTENPMNLLYFHYFISHTARALVPYDDPSTNPFRTILPQMAINNDNLLALLLAYSASHRARVLNHPEPTLRIAFWVDDIFPALREALNDPDRNFSNANLATAIMLASLEIISPKIFGYEIPWQRHLALAREVIMVRPGGLRGFQSNFRQDQVCSFLFSWAAYLDVIGSLTGGPKDASSSWIFDYELDDIDDGYDEIDCIMGFTTRCCYLLAKIADLARKCDAERIGGEDSPARESWAPGPEVIGRAILLEKAVQESLAQSPVPCKHIHTTGNVDRWNRREMEATNAAYHWAALTHLYRRIVGRKATDKIVQGAIKEIISCLGRIRPGSTAESCLLFPMFTAGCDTQNEEHKMLILNRLISAEKHGMTNVHNARRLMQRAWETKRPWETLGSTEFIG